MASLPSPIDGTPMRKVERYGVELDLCVSSGGVWLDKGELEKILRLVREDASQDVWRDRPRRRQADDERDGNFEDDHRGDPESRRSRSRLLDIFDF